MQSIFLISFRSRLVLHRIYFYGMRPKFSSVNLVKDRELGATYFNIEKES